MRKLGSVGAILDQLRTSRLTVSKEACSQTTNTLNLFVKNPTWSLYESLKVP